MAGEAPATQIKSEITGHEKPLAPATARYLSIASWAHGRLFVFNSVARDVAFFLRALAFGSHRDWVQELHGVVNPRRTSGSADRNSDSLESRATLLSCGNLYLPAGHARGPHRYLPRIYRH